MTKTDTFRQPSGSGEDARAKCATTYTTYSGETANNPDRDIYASAQNARSRFNYAQHLEYAAELPKCVHRHGRSRAGGAARCSGHRPANHSARSPSPDATPARDFLQETTGCRQSHLRFGRLLGLRAATRSLAGSVIPPLPRVLPRVPAARDRSRAGRPPHTRLHRCAVSAERTRSPPAPQWHCSGRQTSDAGAGSSSRT